MIVPNHSADHNSKSQVNKHSLDLATLDKAFLGSLLPGIVHNLATPLSGVMGAAQLLEQRANTLVALCQDCGSRGLEEHVELRKQLDKNRANVDILVRNAKHLADILQVMVQRISRATGGTAALYSLNEALQSELHFLEANLTFKHKVRKVLRLCPESPPVRFVYGHLASVLDEFVVHSIALHDPAQGNMSMEFVTAVTGALAELVITVRYVPQMPPVAAETLLETYLNRLRAEGWVVELEDQVGHRVLRLAIPVELNGA